MTPAIVPLSGFEITDTSNGQKSCPDCLSIWNRLWYGGALSPDEQACCAGAERAQIQTVPDNLATYYAGVVTPAQQAQVQAFATVQEAKAASDVAALSNQDCPWSVFGNCYASLTDLIGSWSKYALYIGIVAVILYGLVILGGARFARKVTG
jgi:hypothetical protein